jgi:hypothetical protein
MGDLTPFRPAGAVQVRLPAYQLLDRTAALASLSESLCSSARFRRCIEGGQHEETSIEVSSERRQHGANPKPKAPRRTRRDHVNRRKMMTSSAAAAAGAIVPAATAGTAPQDVVLKLLKRFDVPWVDELIRLRAHAQAAKTLEEVRSFRFAPIDGNPTSMALDHIVALIEWFQGPLPPAIRIEQRETIVAQQETVDRAQQRLADAQKRLIELLTADA